ncbi:twin-arginine translocase TatA/TatE family subunit [Arthrobacter russicus]|jgi:sec-independent protein translocase protein TatB|uniref:Sec-independent protein translocase protein TatB n=1 Tax=Arthrobacter russicus TaxID=172040 RepID=A0ABU1JBG1_9MICC|nr:twin-arginine translocase TatA/TatE family subunit [Arthrobacter russicus]MDR6268742.1 sec-independent protein translocase protein TatB [Arthrobacter russicus]
MFNINGFEFLIIGIIAVLVIGPKRLPEYTQKFRNFVREARRMASGARETIKEESGVDLDSIDWQKLDPRQYDPRRIIREALLDDEVKPVSAAAPAAIEAAPAPVPSREIERLAAGQRAPWDAEAT